MISLILVFVFGLVIGSFLNVVIYRLPKKESIITPPSHCPNCNTRLKAVDLIPVVSFLINRGRCRYCDEPISWQYPFVELLTGILFLLTYLRYGSSFESIIFILLISLLVVVSFIDLKYKLIPNLITYPGIIIGIGLSFFSPGLTYVNSILGAVIPAAALFIIALIFKQGMGMGDVKLVAMIGAFIGWQFTLSGIFIGSFIGSIIGIILIWSGVIKRKTRIPFGPLISFGCIMMILYGNELIELYTTLFFP